MPATRRSASQVARGEVALGRVVGLGAGLVVAGGVVLRLVGLDRQGYWGDELFSVDQARGSLGRLWAIALGEVHPPLYALLLDGWLRLGGTGAAWTRLFSALCGLLTVVVAGTSLRRAGLSPQARLLAVAGTASSGFAIVYAQEARSYALLLLAATGLTGATLRLATVRLETVGVETVGVETVGLETADRRGWTVYRAWIGWGLLGSATHLFGLVLALGAAVVLGRHACRKTCRWTRRRTAPGNSAGGQRRLVRAALVVAVPQLLWLVAAVGRPGFPESTGWIRPPTAGSVLELATTVLAAGGLEPHNDGFAWLSRWGLAVLLTLAALGAILRARRPAGAAPREPDRDAVSDAVSDAHSDAVGAALLLELAVVVIAGTFVVSQGVHVWTLRNLIVVQPALTWGLALGVSALPGPAVVGRARQLMAALVLTAMAAGLASTAVALGARYKNDTGGVARYLLAVHEQHPDTTLVIADVVPPTQWFLSTERPTDDPAVVATFAAAQYVPRTVAGLERVRRVDGPMVVVYNLGAAVRDRDTGKDADQLATELIGRLGAPPCQREPFYGMIVVRCPAVR